MREKDIEIQAADGAAEAGVIEDEKGKKLPGVLMLTDISGIRASSRKLAHRVADLGYTVLMPNVFYRTTRLPIWPDRPDKTSEAWKKRFADLSTPLTPEAMARDTAAYIDLLAGHPAAAPGPLAVVGYCF